MIAYSFAGKHLEEGIRRFDMRRDLAQLADLIEVAFESELERTGNRIVTEMRQLSRVAPLLWLSAAGQSTFPGALGGYVWVEAGQLVGNVSLSTTSIRRGVWVISNVAVHPEYRSSGIAEQLMQATLRQARDENIGLVILEVQQSNLPAQRLYRRLGFEVYDTIAELSLPAEQAGYLMMQAIPSLRRRRAEDSKSLHLLFRAATPRRAQQVKPVCAQDYSPGIDRRLERWLDDLVHLRRRAERIIEQDGAIVALLGIVGQYALGMHRLEITVHPGVRGRLERQLVSAGLDWLRRFPRRRVQAKVSTSHGEALRAYRRAGFREVRVLDQMRLCLKRKERRAES